MKQGRLNLKELDQAYTAVVQLATQPPRVIHQVTLRPDKIKGDLIRLGETQGDEILGWQYPENIEVVEILGSAHEVDGKWECRPLALGS